MPREFQQDGEIAFSGFNSFPNSAAFEQGKGTLEMCENMRIDAGVMRPRLGALKVKDSFVTDVAYAATARTNNGDRLYVFQADGVVKSLDLSNPTSSPTTISGVRQFNKVSGQGYNALAAVEAAQTANWSGATEFSSACNVVERLAYAKNDQIWFTTYGGVQPYNPDTVSLVLNTHDAIQKLHFSSVTRRLYAFGSSSIYEIEPNLSVSGSVDGKPNEQFFHKVKLLSAQEGIASPDTVDETNGNILWLNNGGINKIELGKGMVEGELPITIPVHDIFGGRDHSDMYTSSAVAFGGRYYLAYPEVGTLDCRQILVVNTALASVFESVDRYPFVIKHLVKGRDESGVLHAYAVTPSGTIYKLESNANDDGTAITSKFRTRNYNFKTDMNKRYDAVCVRLDTKGSASVETRFITENPDSTNVIDTFTGNLGTAVRRGLAAKNSVGGKIEVIVTSGRPHFYGCSVDATVAGRSLFNIL